MKYTVTSADKDKVEIKVEISQADFVTIYNEVLEQLAKDAHLPGFRPGHVPPQVAEQHVGPAKILNETASFLISKHLSQILDKEEITPLGSPNIAIGSLAKDSPFSFTVTVTRKPKVTIGDWKKIKVKKIAAKEITEKEVTESIKNIFEAWQKEKSKMDGSEEQEEENKSRYIYDAHASPPAEPGEAAGGKFIYDAYGNKIYLKNTSEKGSSPSPKATEDEINDAFAKAIGAKDLAHLREIVKKDLETIVTDQVEAKLEDDIFEKILELAKMEVPEILVEDELNRMVVRLGTRLEQQGSNLEKYCKEQETTLNELKNSWLPQAEKNVKTSLIIEEIGKQEKVEVTREELDEALKGVDQTNLSAEQKTDLEKYLAVSIFQAKTLDFVKKAAMVSEL